MDWGFREEIRGRDGLAVHQTCFIFFLGKHLDHLPSNPPCSQMWPHYQVLANGKGKKKKPESHLGLANITSHSWASTCFSFKANMIQISAVTLEPCVENDRVLKCQVVGSLKPEREVSTNQVTHLGHVRNNFYCFDSWHHFCFVKEAGITSTNMLELKIPLNTCRRKW